MILTVLLSLLALVFAAVFLGGLDSLASSAVKNNPHPATGLTVLVLALLNPVMAQFRPHPGTARCSGLACCTALHCTALHCTALLQP